MRDRRFVHRAVSLAGVAPPVWTALLVGIAMLGCASRPPEPKPRVWTEARAALASELEAALHAGAPAAAGEVVVRLAFGEGADLDLYVTDPLQETVYFANTPIASSGVLESDRICGPERAAARIETVRFPVPPPGRYRVGVDYPSSCHGRRDDVPFAVAVDVGGERQIFRGLARFVVFDLIVTEFQVGMPGEAGSP